MKPLIPYYGGKQRIAPKIVECLNEIPHKIYAEPFAGGLSVLYAKPVPVLPNKAEYIEAVNDKNEMIVSLYRVVRTDPEGFFELIQWTPYSKAELTKANQIYNGFIPSSEMDKAWAVFVACHMSFSHSIGAGWRYARKAANTASQWSTTKNKLWAALQRLSDVHIDRLDACDFIDRWDSPDTLFYCDPPYPGADQGHYSGYSIDDFENLCRKLDNAKGSYVLSNYQQDVEPKTTQKRIEINAFCSASGYGRTRGSKALSESDSTRTEMLYICDRSPSRTLQKSLFSLEAIAL